MTRIVTNLTLARSMMALLGVSLVATPAFAAASHGWFLAAGPVAAADAQQGDANADKPAPNDDTPSEATPQDSAAPADGAGDDAGASRKRSPEAKDDTTQNAAQQGESDPGDAASAEATGNGADEAPNEARAPDAAPAEKAAGEQDDKAGDKTPEKSPGASQGDDAPQKAGGEAASGAGDKPDKPAAQQEKASAEKPAQAQVVKRSRSAMGTRMQIQVFTDDPEGARKAIDEAFAEMQRVSDLMSDWTRDSDVSRLNRAAGKEAVSISAETLDVLERAKAISELTDGAFSVTWAALGSLWNFSPGAEDPSIPTEGRTQQRTELVDDAQLLLDKSKGTAKLQRAGMAVGLGGIAKGYAIDRAVDVLEAAGFHDALIFAGGDIRVRGAKGDRPWLIGIQDPRAKGYFAVLPMKSGAIATSGDYENYFTRDGVRYHHLLDPRTGRPARGVRSVTVVAQEGLSADGLATAAFVLGVEKGLELIENQANTEALFVDAQGQVTISSGLKSRVRILNPPANPETAKASEAKSAQTASTNADSDGKKAASKTPSPEGATDAADKGEPGGGDSSRTDAGATEPDGAESGDAKSSEDGAAASETDAEADSDTAKEAEDNAKGVTSGAETSTEAM